MVFYKYYSFRCIDGALGFGQCQGTTHEVSTGYGYPAGHSSAQCKALGPGSDCAHPKHLLFHTSQ